MNASSASRFHAGDILSVLQPRLVSPDGAAGVQRLLEFMTDDALGLHQLGRAQDECRDSLAAQHPDLAAIAAAGIPAPVLADRDTGLAWLATLPDADGRVVAPLGADDHTHVDAETEFFARYGFRATVVLRGEE